MHSIELRQGQIFSTSKIFFRDSTTLVYEKKNKKNKRTKIKNKKTK